MKGFERRQIKKSLSLPLLRLTSSIFSSVCLTFALFLVLCCAGTTSVCSFDTIDSTHIDVYINNSNAVQLLITNKCTGAAGEMTP